jgi:hypothetical protein
VFRSKRKPPSAHRPKLDRNERIITWASTVDNSGAVVVTTSGVWLPGRGRLGWHEIHKAAWNEARELTVVPAVKVADADHYAVMADDTPVAVNLAEPEDVPAEIRKRVTRSVAYSAYHPLPGGGVRVVARRVAGIDGLTWHVRYDEGTDQQDPEIVAATEEFVAEASA